MKKDKAGGAVIEAKWILSRIGPCQGKVLDFGSGSGAPLARKIAELGFDVTCIDLLPPKITPGGRLHYIQGDITKLKLSKEWFDIIINSSSIEHAGLAGRYGSKDEPDQDLQVMQILKDLLTPQGVHFLTIPVGVDAVFGYHHRVYGEGRLLLLLNGWKIIESEFWKKAEDNIYRKTDGESALKEIPTGPEKPRYYALGLYLLEK